MNTPHRIYICLAYLGIVGLSACASPPAVPDNGGKHQQPPVSISTSRQQLVGMTTAVATRKQVQRTIRTVGRVAFDPELALAQQEFLGIAQRIPSLKSAARSRLRLLGMTDDDIDTLSTRKHEHPTTSLYLPERGDAVWVYATIFPSEMNAVTPGLHASIALPNGSEKIFAGIVHGITPVVDATTRTVTARIEVPHAGGTLRPDTYVNVEIQVELGEALTIPKTAVLYTGTRHLVFVQRQAEEFEQREVTTGTETANDVVVTAGVTAGERVVDHAAYVVDSESQLQRAGAAGLPSCPEGQTWDMSMAMCMPAAGHAP